MTSSGASDFARLRVMLSWSWVRTALVFALLGVLFVATSFASGAYRRERERRAEAELERGRALVADGHLSPAIDAFRSSLELARDGIDAQYELGLALVGLGQDAEARAYLRTVVDRQPSRSMAHLALARIAARTRRFDDARRRYEAAITGQWPPDGESRLDARMELIQLLREARLSREAVAAIGVARAELTPDDPRQAELAAWLASEGQRDEAADVLRAYTEAAGNDGGAFARLGHLELTRFQFASARAAFLRAVEITKAKDLQEFVALCESALRLDPSGPRLRTRTRLLRGRDLLRLAAAMDSRCRGEVTAIDPRSVEAARLLALPVSRVEGPESYVDLATGLRAARPSGCLATSPEERALDLVLDKLAAS